MQLILEVDEKVVVYLLPMSKYLRRLCQCTILLNFIALQILDKKELSSLNTVIESQLFNY
jgi:hypothetical protein